MTTERPAALFVVSPHCDDAVLGCGETILRSGGAVVATVFAGRPRPLPPLTEWDRLAGYGEGDDVVAARRREDARAMAVLGARPVWLEHLESQYGRAPDAGEVADSIEGALDASGASSALVPLGLFHADHVLAHEACLRVAARRPGLRWLAYEDAIYRRVDDQLERRLESLARRGLRPRRLRRVRGGDAKWRAMACYISQLRALSAPGKPGYLDAFEAEGLWRLEAGAG